MRPALLRKSPKCSSESRGEHGACLCFMEPWFFPALMCPNTIKIHSASLKLGYCLSTYRWVIRVSSVIQEVAGSQVMLLLNYSLSEESDLLFQKQVLVPETIKTPSILKIGCHIEHHKLLQSNIPSFIHARTSHEEEWSAWGRQTQKPNLVSDFFWFPLLPNSVEARRQLYLIM